MEYWIQIVEQINSQCISLRIQTLLPSWWFCELRTTRIDLFPKGEKKVYSLLSTFQQTLKTVWAWQSMENPTAQLKLFIWLAAEHTAVCVFCPWGHTVCLSMCVCCDKFMHVQSSLWSHSGVFSAALGLASFLPVQRSFFHQHLTPLGQPFQRGCQVSVCEQGGPTRATCPSCSFIRAAHTHLYCHECQTLQT